VRKLLPMAAVLVWAGVMVVPAPAQFSLGSLFGGSPKAPATPTLTTLSEVNAKLPAPPTVASLSGPSTKTPTLPTAADVNQMATRYNPQTLAKKNARTFNFAKLVPKLPTSKKPPPAKKGPPPAPLPAKFLSMFSKSKT
jgi:hypothetical protein